MFRTIPYNILPMKTLVWKKNKELPSSYEIEENIRYPVFRQHSCGACWAWSIAACLSDRYSLMTNRQVVISPTSIISGILCKMQKSSNIDLYNACEGGSAFDALHIIKTITNSNKPVKCKSTNEDLRLMFKTMDCDNYDWCELNPVCNINSNLQNSIVDHFTNNKINSIVPPYTSHCQKHNITHDFKTITTKLSMKDNLNIKLSRVYKIEDIETIKYNILKKGSVISNFVVYPDLVYKQSQEGLNWNETNNIYIHMKGKDFYNTGIDNDNLLGYHSVTIVGWGEDKIESSVLGITSNSQYIKVPYWIARNTWGEKWNNGGYFKIAFTSKKFGINTEVGFDIPIVLHINNCYKPCGTPCNGYNDDNCQYTKYGGCCAADINDEEVLDGEIEERDMNDVITTEMTQVYAKTIPSNFPQWWIYGVKHLDCDMCQGKDYTFYAIVFLVIIMIVILFYIFCRFKLKQKKRIYK